MTQQSGRRQHQHQHQQLLPQRVALASSLGKSGLHGYVYALDAAVGSVLRSRLQDEGVSELVWTTQEPPAELRSAAPMHPQFSAVCSARPLLHTADPSLQISASSENPRNHHVVAHSAGVVLRPEDLDAPKLVIVCRNDIPMSAGKLAAQAAHAAVGAYRRHCVESTGDTEQALVCNRWKREGEKIVVLSTFKRPASDRASTAAPSVAESGSGARMLEALAREARALGLPLFQVVDAGHTEVPPRTCTCIAIGPAATGRIDAVTGDLQLFTTGRQPEKLARTGSRNERRNRQRRRGSR